MSTKRLIMVGWDRPLCETVPEFLLAEGGPGCLDLRGTVVVVPTRQSSWRLRAALPLAAEARGRVLSRQQIEERLYSWDAAVESNAVEVHIHHLRRKLGSAAIQTMRGVGYFMPQEKPA